MINKMLPERTFSPRSFMGDRGILLDNLGRVLRADLLHEEKIVAPKAWKACKSPILSRPSPWDEDLFGEAGQEIQTILFQNNFNMTTPPPPVDSPPNGDDRDHTDQELMESHFPVFTASPCISCTPITPPTRSLNPMVYDISFSHENDRVPEGAELGLLSVSPPLRGIFGTF